MLVVSELCFDSKIVCCLSRMKTAEHLPSGWPFESSHYKSTFRTPQLGYCRHNVYPSSVHRKNNPHAALIDPYQYPDKVMLPSFLTETNIFSAFSSRNIEFLFFVPCRNQNFSEISQMKIVKRSILNLSECCTCCFFHER